VGLVALAALLGALVVLLLVRDDDEPAAGGEQPTTTADAGGGDLDIDVPDGFEAFVDEEEGFALALPEEWTELDLSDPNLQDALDAAAEANPGPAGQIEQARAVAESGGVLFALDTTSPGGPTSFSVIKGPVASSAEAIEGIAEEQLEAQGAENVSTEILDLPAGEAVRVQYDLTINGPGGEAVVIYGIQYAVPRSDATWTFTFSTTDPEADEATADAIMESFTAAD
jgi:hypothetical protein